MNVGLLPHTLHGDRWSPGMAVFDRQKYKGDFLFFRRKEKAPLIIPRKRKQRWACSPNLPL